MDLAGSERLDRSGVGNDAQRLKETQNINKSLSCLADVFAALSAKSSHIPFRNSKLTYLMQVGADCVAGRGGGTHFINRRNHMTGAGRGVGVVYVRRGGAGRTLLLLASFMCWAGRGAGGGWGGHNFVHGCSRMTIVVCGVTLAPLQCRDGARRVFTHQAGGLGEGVLVVMFALVFNTITRASLSFRDGAPCLLLVETSPTFGRWAISFGAAACLGGVMYGHGDYFGRLLRSPAVLFDTVAIKVFQLPYTLGYFCPFLGGIGGYIPGPSSPPAWTPPSCITYGTVQLFFDFSLTCCFLFQFVDFSAVSFKFGFCQLYYGPPPPSPLFFLFTPQFCLVLLFAAFVCRSCLAPLEVHRNPSVY